MSDLPVIDISALVSGTGDVQSIGREIHDACTTSGFFYITGHGVPKELLVELEQVSKTFFELPVEQKMKIHMSKGGSAWRGYFPVGEELTSGKPDLKEGLYFGTELSKDHPDVVSETPLHGSNLFPDDIVGFKEVVLNYMEALTALGHTLMRGLSISLGLDAAHFNREYTADPFLLFRIFHYPYHATSETWGVGEHTDYGVLTILKQDDSGGLQVKSDGNWIDAPPIPDTFVCNIGDMLDRMTRGYYRSTPHRVRNLSGRNRLSWPFFFDPGFKATIKPLDLGEQYSVVDDRDTRWDKSSVHDFQGTYGNYILRKVAHVFPELIASQKNPE